MCLGVNKTLNVVNKNYWIEKADLQVVIFIFEYSADLDNTIFIKLITRRLNEKKNIMFIRKLRPYFCNVKWPLIYNYLFNYYLFILEIEIMQLLMPNPKRPTLFCLTSTNPL